MRLSGAWRRTLFAPAVLGVSTAVFLPWLGFDYALEPHKSALNDYWKARVPDVLNGRAHRPFVQRALVPWSIVAIRRALPRPALRAIRRTVTGSPLFLPRKFGALGWEPAYLTEYAIAIPLLFAWLAAFPFAFRRLFLALYDAPGAADAASLLALALLPVLFFDRGTHYLYDFASLTLFTLALAFLARRRTGAFYATYVVGLVNKETMVLATIVFAFAERRRLSRRRLVTHLCAQASIAVAILAAIQVLYRHNPGGATEWHLAKNLRLMRASIAPASLVLAASVVVLVLARLRAKPPFLRQALLAVLPLGAIYVTCGIWGEVRALYEAYPVLFLLAFDNACAALGFPLRRHGDTLPPLPLPAAEILAPRPAA